MSDTALPLAMAALALGGILAGYRVALVLAGAAALFILISDLPLAYFNLLNSRIYANVLSNWLLVAIPMFVFMGLVLEKSGVAEQSLRAAQAALGGSAAGMGVSVLLVSVLLAASSGIVGASVVLLALLALPRLTETGYDRPTAAGLVAASGTLAILIPPSVMLIVLGDQLQTPVPDMFAGALGPGLILVAIYGAFVAFRARGLAPGAPVPTGSALRLLVDLGPLLALVVAVLGSIVAGLATPTEASGLGAFGAILIAALYGRFRLTKILDAARETITVTSMVLLVMIGATCFSAVFKAVGGDDLVEAGVLVFGDGPFTVLAVVMAAIFVLGFVLDWLEITLILMPIFAPIVAGLDFGNGLSQQATLVWFGILVAVNLQTSFLTPPFGFSLFYLRGAAGSQLATPDIYRGVVPFILLQLAVLALIILFPGLVTGLI
ncbi:MAG: TRAP transporter large permease subunit [Pseudomonadota bacterium]